MRIAYETNDHGENIFFVGNTEYLELSKIKDIVGFSTEKPIKTEINPNYIGIFADFLKKFNKKYEQSTEKAKKTQITGKINDILEKLEIEDLTRFYTVLLCKRKF